MSESKDATWKFKAPADQLSKIYYYHAICYDHDIMSEKQLKETHGHWYDDKWPMSKNAAFWSFPNELETTQKLNEWWSRVQTRPVSMAGGGKHGSKLVEDDFFTLVFPGSKGDITFDFNPAQKPRQSMPECTISYLRMGETVIHPCAMKLASDSAPLHPVFSV